MMLNFGCFILPRDLLLETLRLKVQKGWYGGFEIENEWLFVVFFFETEEGPIRTSAKDRLQNHRATCRFWGKYKDHLLEWTVVESGSVAKLRDKIILPIQDFESITRLSIENFRSAPHSICAIEAHDDWYAVQGFHVAVSDQNVLMLPLEYIEVEDTADALARLPVRNRKTLADRKVMIVGAGSGGGEIALSLAAAGLGVLEIIDDQRIRPANYFRHVSDQRELGRRKTHAVGSAIRDRELPCNISVDNTNVLASADSFREKLNSKPDLIICATDSRESRRFLNYCAVRMGIPVIIAGTLDSGRIGEVICVCPDRTACYECVRLELAAVLEPVETAEANPPGYGASGEDGVTESALRSDVITVAALAVRVALHVIDPVQFPSLPEDYIVWGREASSTYPPPFRFEVPLSINYVRIKRRDDCPVCGNLADDLIGIDIAQKYEEILAEAKVATDPAAA